MKQKIGNPKFRGKRRYFRKLQNSVFYGNYLFNRRVIDSNIFENWEFIQVPSSDNYFDFFHIHFDFYGLGNKSFKQRIPHLDKLFKHFEKLDSVIGGEFQSWIIVYDKDSSDDSLYMHSRNPNNDNFPYYYKNLSSENSLKNNNLIDYLNNLPEGFVKFYGRTTEESFCVLYKKDFGLPVTEF